MKKGWKIAWISVLGVVVLIIILSVLYINNVGYSNVKQMYRLETGENSIVQLESITPGQERYLTKFTKSDRPRELLKDRMGNEGWTFIQQDGSGHFFEKNGQQVIVQAQRWNRFFVLYTLESDVANLAD
ncbi:hypothetical protein [Paenibacillus sp. QZ-Y1]|uniref:hypothetical protein n=1 Tax=Paenibacillus sp. QZ-Y1 TaxID=3414511 RepID=UPI003F7918E3